MAPDEKPYRVYRGGRTKGKVPTPATRAPPRRAPRPKGGAAEGGAAQAEYRGPGAPTACAAAAGGGGSSLGILVLLVARCRVGVASWFVVLAAASGPPTSGSTQDARRSRDAGRAAALASDDDPAARHRQRARRRPRRRQHSDSIMLVRTDPSHHRIAYLSIPRDLLRADSRASATQKINAAFQIGGPALAIRTIREFTGLQIDHVMVVDFANFKDLIDAARRDRRQRARADPLEPLRLPLRPAGALRRVAGLALQKGTQHMNGERALIYSRIRENMLNPRETDLTRGARQQDVMQAVDPKLTSLGVLLQLPFSGDSLREAARRPTSRPRSCSSSAG